MIQRQRGREIWLTDLLTTPHSLPGSITYLSHLNSTFSFSHFGCRWVWFVIFIAPIAKDRCKNSIIIWHMYHIFHFMSILWEERTSTAHRYLNPASPINQRRFHYDERTSYVTRFLSRTGFSSFCFENKGSWIHLIAIKWFCNITYIRSNLFHHTTT